MGTVAGGSSLQLKDGLSRLIMRRPNSMPSPTPHSALLLTTYPSGVPHSETTPPFPDSIPEAV